MWSDSVELQHLDRVSPKDLVRNVLVEALTELLDVRLGVRPSRVSVGIVGLEADVVLAYFLERTQTVAVGGEASEDPSVVLGGRRNRDLLLCARPRIVVLPDRVGALENVGDPSDLALRVSQLQLREPEQVAREQPVGHRRDRI